MTHSSYYLIPVSLEICLVKRNLRSTRWCDESDGVARSSTGCAGPCLNSVVQEVLWIAELLEHREGPFLEHIDQEA